MAKVALGQLDALPGFLLRELAQNLREVLHVDETADFIIVKDVNDLKLDFSIFLAILQVSVGWYDLERLFLL